jgi:hypothetical protein
MKRSSCSEVTGQDDMPHKFVFSWPYSFFFLLSTNSSLFGAILLVFCERADGDSGQ